MLGYPDRSLEELRAAVRSAETLRHPFTLAQTLCFVALVHIFRHEPSAAADCAGRALRICDEQRIAHFHAYALCVGGWALAASGESEKGLAQIAQGVDGFGIGAYQHILLALQAAYQQQSRNIAATDQENERGCTQQREQNAAAILIHFVGQGLQPRHETFKLPFRLRLSRRQQRQFSLPLLLGRATSQSCHHIPIGFLRILRVGLGWAPELHQRIHVVVRFLGGPWRRQKSHSRRHHADNGRGHVPSADPNGFAYDLGIAIEGPLPELVPQ